MSGIAARYRSLNKRQKEFIKFGIPFFIFMIAGTFGVNEFTRIRFDYFSKPQLKPEDVEKAGVKMKKKGEVTLDTEFEKIKTIDINNWENKRGPRPWEEKLN